MYKENAKQYVLWNANIDYANPNHIIAFTIFGKKRNYANNNLFYEYNAHNRRNETVDLGKYFIDNKLEYLFEKLSIKKTFEKIIDSLNYYTEFPKKYSCNFTQRFQHDNFYDRETVLELMHSNLIEKYQTYDNVTLLKLLKCSDKTSNAIVLYYIFRNKLYNDINYFKLFENRVQSIVAYIKIDDANSIDMLKQTVKLLLSNETYNNKHVTSFGKIFTIISFKDFFNNMIREIDFFVNTYENILTKKSNIHILFALKRKINSKCIDKEDDKIRKNLLSKINSILENENKKMFDKNKTKIKEIIIENLDVNSNDVAKEHIFSNYMLKRLRHLLKTGENIFEEDSTNNK